MTSNPALRVCMSLVFLYNHKSVEDRSNHFTQAIRHTSYPLTDECVEVPMDATMVGYDHGSERWADITDDADAETENLIEGPLHSRAMFCPTCISAMGHSCTICFNLAKYRAIT